MKRRSLLLSFTFVLVTISNPQIPKGSIWVGGNIGFNHSDDEAFPASKQTNLFISPAIGLAFQQNKVYGIQLNYNESKSNSSGIESKNSEKGVGIFLRRYWPIINRLTAFGQLGATYADIFGKTETPNYRQEVNGWNVRMSASPGISYALNRTFQIESSFSNLFYLEYTKKQSDLINTSGKTSTDSHSYGGGVILNNQTYFNIGFRLLISK